MWFFYIHESWCPINMTIVTDNIRLMVKVYFLLESTTIYDSFNSINCSYSFLYFHKSTIILEVLSASIPVRMPNLLQLQILLATQDRLLPSSAL